MSVTGGTQMFSRSNSSLLNARTFKRIFGKKSSFFRVEIIYLVSNNNNKKQNIRHGLGLALHPSSNVASPQHFVSSLFHTKDLSVQPSIFNKFPPLFPIILSLLLSLHHCGVVTPDRDRERGRERLRERQFEGGEREREKGREQQRVRFRFHSRQIG